MTSNLTMYNGIVRKNGEIYEVMGSPEYLYSDWAVVAPFNITTEDFISASSTPLAEFPDYEHYGIQMSFGKDMAIAFKQTSDKGNTTYDKRVGWSLNYYNKELDTLNAVHSVLYGSIKDLKIIDNRFTGKLVIEGGYNYFPFSMEETIASSNKPIGALGISGYSFDFKIDDKGRMLNEVILTCILK